MIMRCSAAHDIAQLLVRPDCAVAVGALQEVYAEGSHPLQYAHTACFGCVDAGIVRQLTSPLCAQPQQLVVLARLCRAFGYKDAPGHAVLIVQQLQSCSVSIPADCAQHEPPFLGVPAQQLAAVLSVREPGLRCTGSLQQRCVGIAVARCSPYKEAVSLTSSVPGQLVCAVAQPRHNSTASPMV
eukprot:13820-Heterococcus_DN1.PRE.2